MPTPVSRTVSTASGPSGATVMSTRPWGGVYFRALSRRFATTCCRRVASASHLDPGAGHGDDVLARLAGLVERRERPHDHVPEIVPAPW